MESLNKPTEYSTNTVLIPADCTIIHKFTLMDAKTTVKTNAERQKSFRNKRRNDDDFKEKERQRKREERARKRQNQTEEDAERVRTLARERQRRRRLRLKNQNLPAGPQGLSCKSRQALLQTATDLGLVTLPKHPVRRRAPAQRLSPSMHISTLSKKKLRDAVPPVPCAAEIVITLE